MSEARDDPRSELELLQRARAGETAALTALLARWEPSLQAIARSLTRRQSRLGFDTHDLMATAIRRLLARGPDAFDRPEAASLLATILRGAYVDKLREELARRRREADARRGAPHRHASSLGLSELSRESMRPDDWELVMLWKEGLSWTRIAEQLGIPADRARQRWHRLMGRLRETESGAPRAPAGPAAPRAGDRPSARAGDRGRPPDRPA